MKNLAKALCLPILLLWLSPTSLMASSATDAETASPPKPVYLISVVTLKGDKVNRALRKTLKKIAQTAKQMHGEALGDFTVEQARDREMTLVVRLPSKAKLGRFQKLADPHYIRLRKSVESEYRFVAEALESDVALNSSYLGPFIKVRDVKGHYPKLELQLSQE